MPSTPDHGLHYPGPDDLPDGPTQMGNLATDTEAALQALVPDSGVKANLSVTPEPDWDVAVAQYRTIGKKMELHLQLIYSGTGITANIATDPNPGNIPDTTIATIADAAHRPVMQAFGCFRCSVTSGSVQLNVDGPVRIIDAHTASTIGNGDSLHIHAVYPIP